MKLKVLALTLFVAGFGASLALADDGHGDKGATTGTTETTTTESHKGSKADCRRFELHGTLVSVAASSLTLTVQKANAAAGVAAGAPATVAVGPKTRVKWEGYGTFTGPNAGDRVEVNGCAAAAGGTLTADRVEARTPREPKPEQKPDKK
jgi:hypothetical protein